MTPLFRAASTTHFDRLYEQHAAAVYRYARAVLGNHADAEDVAQQTFLNVYRALAQGTKPRKAQNWIFTIAHNEVRRHLRDTRSQRLEVELDAELADHTEQHTAPSVTDVLRALQHLTPNQRSALVMREFEGRPYGEIAEILQITSGALETLMFRARRSLAEALEDGLTCAEAELAVSRRLDGRLSRREARRLKKHVRECGVCRTFEQRQRRQRSLLQGLSVIPVPASLLAFRGEQAAAAIGGGTAVGAAAAGGSAGIAAKAAAVVAAATVAGGVGYTAGTDRLPTFASEPSRQPNVAAHTAAAARTAAATARPVGGATPTSRPTVGRAHERKQQQKQKATPPRTDREPLKAKAKKADRKPARGHDRSAGKTPRQPEPAVESSKVKPRTVTPTRKRPVHEPKSKPKDLELKRATRPDRPVTPEPVVKAVELPTLPPGIEKKAGEAKAEKTKLP